MSKLSFRSRQVDYNKPLPIYLNHDLPDLQDFAAINRTVPQMPTGMEKDEEAEHHLQRALSAFQAFGVTSTQDYAIPTPRVEIDDKLYERIYNYECIKQKQYIRIQPFSNDYDYPDYDADWEDQQWVKEQHQTNRVPVDFSDDLCLFFETVMDCLEKATGFSQNVMTREEASALLKKEAYTHTSEENEFLKRKLYSKQYENEKEAFLVSVYEYWKAKRLRLRHPLTPTVMTDKSGVVTAPNNPYLVFRRRTEKMQTRKNRKNEEHSYENMLILKRDLLRAQQILRVIKQRESLKKDLMKLTLEQVEKRFKANDFDGSIVEGIKNTLRPPSLSHHNTNSQSAIDLLVSNPAFLKQLGLAPHQLDSRTLTNLIQQNPRLKNFVSSMATNAAAVNAAAPSAAAANNKRPVDTSANKKLIVGKKNLVNHSTSSSPGDHLKSSALTNHQRLNQMSATQLNTSKKSATVNSSNKLSQMSSMPGALNKSSVNKYGDLVGANKLSMDVVNSNNKRRLVRPGSESIGVVNPSLMAETEENNEFVEALKANDIDNLDAVLDDFKTGFESEGAYRFNRKEGCKYLPASGSLFKSDPFELSQTLNKLTRTEYIATLNAAVSSTPAHGLVNNNISDRCSNTKNTGEITTTNNFDGTSQTERNRPIGCATNLLGTGYGAPPAHLKMSNPKRIRQLRELHYKYYGYVRGADNKHLGLVRRRLGRNGRVILERFDPDTVDLLRNPDEQSHHVNHHSIVSAEQQLFSFDIYSKFKTYYPIECFEPTATSEATNSSTNRLTLRLEALSSNRANSGGYDDEDESEDDEDDESGMSKVPESSNGVRYDHTLFPIYYPTYEESVKAASPMEEETEAPVSDPKVDNLFKELFSYIDDQTYGGESVSSDEVEFRADRNIIQLNLRSESRLNQEYNDRRTTSTFHNSRYTNEKNEANDNDDDDEDKDEDDQIEEESFGGDMQDHDANEGNALSASDIKLALRVFQLPKVSNSDMSIIDKNNNINSDCDEKMTEPSQMTTAAAAPTINNQSNGNGSMANQDSSNSDANRVTCLSRETSSQPTATTSVIPTKSAGSVNPGVGLDTTTGGIQLVNSKPNSNSKSEPNAAITTTTPLIDSSPLIVKKQQPNIIYNKSTISSLLQNSSPSSVIQTTMFYSPSSNNSSTSTSSLPSSSSVSSSSSLVNGPTGTTGTQSHLTNGPSSTGLLPTANIINGILSKKQDEYQDNHVSSSATASSMNQSTSPVSEHGINVNKLDHHIHLTTSSTTSKSPPSTSLIVAAATTTTPTPP